MSPRSILGQRDPAAPPVPPPLVAAGVGLGSLVIERLLRLRRTVPSWVRMLGAGTIASGLGLAVWGIAHFHKRETTHSPWSRPTRMVSDGPYALTRNPMYLGTALTLLGVGIARGSLAGVLSPLIYAAVINRWQISFEETALAEAFGNEYTNYRRRVRRWI